MNEDKEESELEEHPLAPKQFKPTREQEAEIFKALAHKTYKQVGHDFGLHLLFGDNKKKISNVIFNIAEKIRKAPELWGISQDAVEVINTAAGSRSIRKNPRIQSEMKLMEESFRDKLDAIRDTAAEILAKKLKKYNTVRGIEGISVRDLKDLLATAIDKSRLLRGESTENIKRLSPLNVDEMSPEDALKVVMKARDVIIENKK